MVGTVERKFNAPLVVVNQFVDDLLQAVRREAAHEAESASHEANNGRYFCLEELAPVKDSPVASNCDYVVDDVVVLVRHEFP